MKSLELIKNFRASKSSGVLHGIHFSEGFAIASDNRVIARIPYTYDKEREERTFDYKTGVPIWGGYPIIGVERAIGPYREAERTISVAFSAEKMTSFIKAGEIVSELLDMTMYDIKADMRPSAIPSVTIHAASMGYSYDLPIFKKFFSCANKLGVTSFRLRADKERCYALANDGSEILVSGYNCVPQDYGVLDLNGGLNARVLRLAELLCLKTMNEVDEAAKKKAGKALKVIRTAARFSGKDTPAPELDERRRAEVERRIAELEAELDMIPEADSTPAAPVDRQEASEGEMTAAPACDTEDGDEPEDEGDQNMETPARTAGEKGRTLEESPEIHARMLEAIGKNTDRQKKGGDIRPYQSIWRPEPLDRIKADTAAEYCVYCRREQYGKFKKETAPGMTGAEAAELLERFQAACAEGVNYPGLAYQIRHRAKGILHEWHWTRKGADEDEPRPVSKRKAPSARGMDREELMRKENLYSHIKAETGGQAAAITKHMKGCGIRGWEDLTKSGLYRLRDELRETCAPASARTYMTTIKGFLARYVDDRGITPEYKEILRGKTDKPVKTWLEKDEIKRLEEVETRSTTEAIVKAQFLIGVYTGMRISDALKVDEANERNGMLSYVSQKTGTEATVPCPEKVRALIAYVQENDLKMSLVTYNDTIRELCRRAGICRTVKTRRGGENREGPKWRFVSSHTARISFATNLANLGVPLVKLAGMMGHSSIQMTERYIAGKPVTLSSKAMTYFE